jgi:hypothetical protein
MRITQQGLSAVGVAPWIPHDTYQTPPAITLAGFVSSGANLTWGVQFTCDDVSPNAARLVLLSQTTTVITITDNGYDGNGHGLSVGDSVTIQGSGYANIDGSYSVTSVTSASVYTLTSLVSQSANSNQAQVITARVFTHAVLTGENGRAVSNYAWPVKASRLQVTAYVSGRAYLEVVQGGMST